MKKTVTFIIALTLLASGHLHAQGFNTPIGGPKPNRLAYIIGPLQVSCGDLVTYSFSTGPLVSDFCSSIKWTITDTNGRYEQYSGENIEIAVGSTPAEMIISVTAKTCDSGYKYSGTESVTIGTVVSSPSTLTGTGFLCNSVSSSYTASAVPGADNYIFSVPSGWKIDGVLRTTFTTSSRTVSITAPSSGSGTGQISVRANKVTTCGSTTSSPRPKTITYGKQFPVIAPRNITVGPSSLLTLTANGQNLSNIRWIIPNGWYALSGLNGSVLDVLTARPTGNYYVEVAAESCGASVGDFISVTIDNSMGVLFTMGQGNGETNISKTENSSSLSEKVTIYPNPTNHSLQWKKFDKGVEIAFISMINISNGEQVLAQPIDDNTAIDLRHIEDGTYIVNMTTQSGEQIQKKVEVIH